MVFRRLALHWHLSTRMERFMAWQTWFFYLLAVIGLSLTPGPNGLLALTHGAMYGQRKTLYTIGGGAAGFVALIGLSMFGIGALLQASSHALTALKWAGGLYLIWIGVQLWRGPALTLAPLGQALEKSGAALFRQGLLSAVSNPKVLLFYGAFLPQFLEPGRSLLLQFVIMAGTFALVEAVVEYQLARFSFYFRPLLERSGKRFNQCCGGLFGLMGAALTVSH